MKNKMKIILMNYWGICVGFSCSDKLGYVIPETTTSCQTWAVNRCAVDPVWKTGKTGERRGRSTPTDVDRLGVHYLTHPQSQRGLYHYKFMKTNICIRSVVWLRLVLKSYLRKRNCKNNRGLWLVAGNDQVLWAF